MVPSNVPSTGQIGLLIVSVAFLLIGGGVSVRRLRVDSPQLRLAARLCFHCGVLTAIAVLMWHSVTRGSWLPLEDNFDSFIWLALLLSLFVLYMQNKRPVGGLDWFVMPIVNGLLICAAVFGRTTYRQYAPSTWFWVHAGSLFAGGIAFAFAAACGAMYLAASRRLRSKMLPAGPSFASLERLEHLTMVAVTLGFALLTLGLITGVMRMIHGATIQVHFSDPKVFLTFIAWVMYALVLHSPINPSFRGRRTAILSIVGFLLLIGGFVGVQFMRGGPQ